MVGLWKRPLNPIPEIQVDDLEEVVSLDELKNNSLDYQTHCLESNPGDPDSLYFVWRYGGNSVSVAVPSIIGVNWSRAIPLFYDASTTLYVAFTESDLVKYGDVRLVRFVVNDECKPSTFLTIGKHDPNMRIYVDDGHQIYNIVHISCFLAWTFPGRSIGNSRYRIPARLITPLDESESSDIVFLLTAPVLTMPLNMRNLVWS